MAFTPPWYWDLVVRYMRRELPAWGKVYDWAGGSDHDHWRSAGSASVRGKLHGYTMRLDLGNWSERLTWCLGRYHDLPLQTALQQLLAPGDCFVDIGANLGMLSLLAHRHVQPSGRVMSFEPNPRMQARIQEAVAANSLASLEIVPVALGAHAGTAELHEFGGHPGWGSLSAAGPAGIAATAKWVVQVVVGDELMAKVPAQHPLVFKVDVEGHEVPVLRGLRETLRTRRPLVFIEIADAHQRRAGYSAAELRQELEQHGYHGHALTMVRRRLFGRALRTQPIATCTLPEMDAVFVPPDGVMAERWRALGR